MSVLVDVSFVDADGVTELVIPHLGEEVVCSVFDALAAELGDPFASPSFDDPEPWYPRDPRSMMLALTAQIGTTPTAWTKANALELRELEAAG